VKRKIPCLCDNSFEVEVPEEIDLDSNKACLDEIENGSFLNFTCPSCGKKHKPEFPLLILWPSRNLRFEVLPELDRGEFYRRKKQPVEKDSGPRETIIGYPEMADRLAVIRGGFDPVPVEAIKYFLQLKAEEQYPDDEIDIWYYGSSKTEVSPENGVFLEFHIHGIREKEVAVMKVPLSLYQKTLDDYNKNPKKELFSALRVRSYLSVKNTMRHEALK
jgi:hypothetical protein